MRIFYSRFAAFTTLIILLATQTIFAQKNQVVNQPNFVRPLGQKQTTGKRQVIKPSEQTSNTKKENYSVQIEGDYSFIHFTDKSSTTASSFFQTFAKDLSLSSSDKFNLLKTENDEIGFTHYRYQQAYNGISVMGGEYLLHEKNGNLISANGNFHSNLSINTIASISKEAAIQAAIKFIGAEKYSWENSEEEQFLKSETNNPNATYYPQAELIIAPKNGIYERENFHLCYKINITSEKPYDIVDVFIDAHTGEFVNKISKIANADVTATGSTLYSGTKTITTDSYNGSYRLRESGRPIQTFNMNNGTNYSNATDFTNPTTSWTSVTRLNSFTISSVTSSWWYAVFADETPDLYIKIKDGSNTTVYSSGYFNNTFPPVTLNNINLSMVNPPYTVEIWDYDGIGDDYGGSYSISSSSGTFNWSGSGNNGTYTVLAATGRAEVDVHWAMEKTYDFYLTQLSRNSFDNSGGIIKNYIHKDVAWNNANWNGTVMSYGDGSGSLFRPLVSIDVVGHEFTHAVVQYTANLQYQGESGALNESFADIFGTAIEFYGATSPNWTMGESIVVPSPFILRSMSNPNGGLQPQPDTYDGTNWINTNGCTPVSGPGGNDLCGVHMNSGVQNFWYYLLCQGGSGTNDIGNTYSVTGIGMNPATQIAYRNLRLYLTSTSNYLSSYYGSLQAAEDLYGTGTTQWNSVNNAWYAVGIGNGTNNNTTYCSGTTYFDAPSGTFSDGSGNTNYHDNSNCIWSIQPVGANTVTVTFSQFNTEANYDTVIVYDGPNENYPRLMEWWGNTLPPAQTSTNGAITVQFKSDININATGWTANYTSSGVAYCGGSSLLTTPTGSLNDGSGGNNYGNNQFCYWYIAPPCASSITLSFSQFNTENGYDGVIVYNGDNTDDPVLLNTSGTNIPASVTSGGEMLVVFLSDFSNRMQGFTANYTSVGSAYCSGVTNLTTDWGLLNDGSGNNNYCNNMNCNWLIQPTGAVTVTLNFVDFDLEAASTDGFSIYDVVEVYDGPNTASPLLGRFAGNSIPPAITSSGTSMYVKFYSDQAVTATGWSAYYTSTTADYCTGLATLTAPSGTFVDGSGGNLYGNNADCQWLIQPPGATSITMGFTAFDTETNYDGVIVYDGNNTNAPVLNSFTGTSIPGVSTSTGGAMLVHFLSDISVRQNGWNAYYNSSVTVGIDEFDENVLQIFPNPNSGTFTIQTNFDKPENAMIRIYNTLGETVKEIQTSNNRIDVKLETASGLYFVELKTEGGAKFTRKITVQ